MGSKKRERTYKILAFKGCFSKAKMEECDSKNQSFYDKSGFIHEILEANYSF